MFEMRIVFPEPVTQKAQFSSMTFDEVYDYLHIECRFDIMQNERIVLSESIAAVEFYRYISKWYSENGIKEKQPFSYAAVEYFEPILAFSYVCGKQWKVASPWIKESLVVDENELDSQVRKVINDLAANLEG